jgi:type III secretion protein J
MLEARVSRLGCRYLIRLSVRAVCVLTLLLGLLGCKVELYSDLDEKEANNILSVLLDQGIPASKTLIKERATVMVDEADVAAAIDILRRSGYPRDRFASLGEIFQKQGLISSPLEERVRYIYGLSQTISETLSQIDGILTARVHIVLPEAQPLDENVKPSSASVFIKHRPGHGIEESIPKIKMIVQNSVEGLSYDKISVALFQMRAAPRSAASSGPPLQNFLGLRVTQDSLQGLAWLLGCLALLLVSALLGIAYLLWRMRQARQQAGGASGV